MSQPAPAANKSVAWLWASALVIGALCVLQAGRLGAPATTFADLVTQNNDFVALTEDVSPDYLFIVLDQRAEALLIYQLRNQISLDFKGRKDLRELFGDTRQPAAAPSPSGPSR